MRKSKNTKPKGHGQYNLYQILFTGVNPAEDAVFVLKEPRSLLADLRIEERLAVLICGLLLEYLDSPLTSAELGASQRRRKDIVRNVVR